MYPTSTAGRELQPRPQALRLTGRALPLLGLLAAIILPSAARAQLLYWDSNGTTDGAGVTPTGTWGLDAFWSTDSFGLLATAAWTPGATAIFSAGSDASGAVTVTVLSTQTAGAIVVEEGTVTLATGVASVGTGNVAVNAGATLVTDSSLRLFASPGATMTLNDGTIRTTNPGAAGTFIDTDFVITLGAAGGAFSYTVPNVLNIVQTASRITGPGALTKTGVGVLAFAGTFLNNDYTGGTIVNEGELRIRTVPNTLPIATAMTVTSPGILNLNSVSQQVGSLTGNGTVGTGSGTLTVSGSTSTTFDGALKNIANAGASGVTTGNGRLVKDGPGAITFNGQNDINGSVTLSNGVINVSPGASLCGPIADLIVHGGLLNLSNAAQIVENLSSVHATGTIHLATGHTLIASNVGNSAFSGSITGAGGILKLNNGVTQRTLTLNGTNSYDGNTIINGGNIAVGSATALGSAAGYTEVASGMEVLFTGVATAFTCAEPFRIAGLGGSDAGAIAVIASANPTLSGPITLTGDATITVSSSASATFNNPAAITSLANQNLTLQGGANSAGVKAVTGVINLGSGGLTKLQGGEWVLSGANVYSGPTTIGAGTLRVANTAGSATGSGAVTVASGATLAGSGIILGSVSVTGTLAAGSSPGTITTGDEIWNGGGTLAWEINDVAGAGGANPGWDLVNIVGTLSITATPVTKFNVNVRSLTLANANGDAANFNNTQDYLWTIATASGGISGFDLAAFNLNTTTFSNAVGSGTFLLEQAGNSINLRFVHLPSIVLNPVSTSAECGLSNATFSVTATGTAPLSYQWRHAGTNLPGANADTLAITLATSDTAGSYDVLVSNAYGTVTSASAMLTVTDTTPPVFNCGQNETVSCSQGWGFTFPIITDNCDGLISGNGVPISTTTNFSCGYTFVATRIWQVTDSSANTTYCTQVVTYVDFIPPTITVCPMDVTVPCLAAVPAPNIFSVTATNQFDPCDTNPPVIVHFSDVTNGVNPIVITRTYRAYDSCSNVAQCVQTITVPADVTPPALTACPASMSLGAGPSGVPVSYTAPTATDCDPAAPVVACLPPSGSTFVLGDTTVTCTATDAAGNPANCSFLITVTNVPVTGLQALINAANPGDTIVVVPGTYAGVTVNKNLTLDCSGGGVVITGASPALTLTMGSLSVTGGTFITATDDPTILVTGGALKLRSVVVEESGFLQSAISVTGGTLDLGLAGDLGGNTIKLIMAGTLLTNGTAAAISALGNTWQQDATPLTSNFDIEDKIFHNLDDATRGLVTYVANNVYVTTGSGSVQRGIDAVATGGQVNVKSGTYTGNADATANAITLAPGASPGQVVLNGNLTLDSNDTLEFELNGATPGADYDQFVVNGTVTLGGAAFTPTAGFAYADCAILTLIENDGVDLVSGTFIGLADGAVVAISGQAFRIFYSRGDGNDVVLVKDTTPPAINCGVSQTVECGTSWNFAIASITDNCDANPTLSLVSTATNSNCGNTYVATRVWQGTDIYGNSTNCTQVVTVVDTTAPMVTCPASITLKTLNIAGEVVPFSASATDLCDPSPALACVPASGSIFPIGTTSVACTAVDVCNNTNSCTFNVTVLLRTATNYLVGAQIPDNNINGLASTKSLVSSIGIVTDVNVTFKTTGGYNGDIYAYLVHDSGFAILLNRSGRTMSDSLGYGDSGYNVTFDDQSSNGDVHVYRFTLNGSHATALGGSLTNSWAPDARASDPLAVLDTPDLRTELLSSFNGLNPNGSWTLFVADVSLVDIAMLDSWGLDICGTLPIPASITTQPSSQTVECSSNLTLTVTTAGTAPLTNQWYYSGSPILGATGTSLVLTNLLPVDSGTYSFVVCNMANCATSAPIVLTVLDTIVPAITACATNDTLPADLACSALLPNLVPQVVASDACSAVTISQVPPAGTSLGLGVTVVTLTVTDLAGNTNACTATITVIDATPPSITCPADIVASTDAGQCSKTNVTFTATALDNCPGVVLVCMPASNSTFPKGVTTVTCTATDGAANTNACTFTVTINDLELPVLACPANITTNITAGCTTAVAFAPAVTDNCPGVVSNCVPASGSTFSLGATPVTCTATDASGNTNACSFTVTVTAAAPSISAGPVNQTTPMGNGAVFAVTATGTATVTYQWESNGVAIAGATGSSVAVSNLTLAASGSQFRVIVSNCAGTLTSAVAVLTVRPVSGLSFDFNTPGQYTNAPYNLVNNDWGNSTLINVQPFGPIVPFEVSTGGVGVATGGGGLDLAFNNVTVNSSTLHPIAYDFSLPGQTLYVSAMMKSKFPLANSRAVQIGFTTATNRDLDNSAGRAYMTVLLNSSNQPGTIYNLRYGSKALAVNTFIEGITNAGSPNVTSATLTTNVWYRFSAVFMNSNALVAGSYAVSATLQNMGLDGTAPGAVVTMPTTSVTNLDITASRDLFFVLRVQENCGVDYLDNVFISSTNGPVYFVDPPASQTVAQGRTASFRALVNGAGPYAYQWSKNGSPITDATQWKYTTPPLAYPGDDGAQYTVTVTSPNNAITSSLAIVTVQPDPLAVLSVGSVDGGLIGLRFNQPVDKTSAETAGNYMVNSVAAVAAQLRVNNGVQQYKTNGTEILLTPLSPVSSPFTVTVSGVTAVSGAVLGANNSAIGRVEGLTGYDVDPLSIGLSAQVGTLPGFNYSFAPGAFEIVAGGHDIAGAFDGFRFLYATYTGDFDLKVRVPYLDALRTPNKAGFDARVSLDPTSPMVGAFLNPMLPGLNRYEGNVRQLYNVNSGGWGGNPAATFPNAWLRFRRVGNTFMRYSGTNGVNWVLDGQTSPVPAFPPTIYVGLAANCNVGTGVIQQHATSQYDGYGDFVGYGSATIAITQQPTNPPAIAAGATPLQTAVVATYTTNGVAAPANELAYVWQRTNTTAGGWTNMPIAGQTTANILTAANIGALFYTPAPAQYRVIISAPGAPSVISDLATITVTDGAPPTVSSPAAFSSNSLPMLSTHQILLNFSEFMDPLTALNPANYTVSNSAAVSMGVASVQFLRGDSRTVVITTIAPLSGDRYFVVINNVLDLSANPIAANTVLNITLRGGTASAVNGEAQVVGPIVVEWTPYIANQRAGIGDILNAVASPAWVSYSNVFGIHPNNANFPNNGVGDNYGVKMFTYFVPPTNALASWTNLAGVRTNGYKFYLRNNEFAELILNTNADPARSILPMDVLVGTSTNSPGAQNAVQAMDGVSSNYANAKYLNFDELNSGFYVTPAIGNTTVGGIRFWAAGDAPERDPMTFTIEGSTNVIRDRDRTGTNGPWTLLASGNTGIANTGGASGTGRYMPSPNVGFANATPYRSYRIIFPTVRDSVAADSMQIGEVQLLNAGGEVVVPSGATVIIQSTGVAEAYVAANSSSNLTLNAGQKYYMEVRFKETATGDGVAVCVTNNNGATVPSQNAVIPGAFCSFPTPLADPTPVQWEMYTIASSFRIQDFVQFGNVANGRIVDLFAYTNVARFVARLPQTIGYCKGFGWNTNQGNLQGTYDNYIARLYAYFVAPTNGLYKFWMALDDSGELWMNTNSANSTEPAGMRLLGQLDGANLNHTLVAQNVVLVAGQRYYLESRWREGGGGDGIRVAVSAQTDPRTPGLGEFIPGSLLEMATNEVRYGEIKLAGITASVDGAAPVTASSLNVLPGSIINFNAAGISGAGTALGINGVANPLSSLGLVWLKNGTSLFANQVQGNLEFYVTPPVSLADHGATITLLVTNTFSVATQAVVINVAAAAAPMLVRAVGSLSDDSVTVTFDRPVDSYTCLQVANYTIPGLRILSVSRDDRTGRRVFLRTSPQAMGTFYTLAVSNVKDASGTQTILPNSMVTFGAWATGGAGAFYVEIYTNIPGSLTENLTTDPKFIYNLPDHTYYTNRFGVGGFGLDSFFQANNYGARVSGWLTAPSNGVYAFYVRGDDGTKVFMNTNGSDPSGKVLIARNDGANSGTFVNGLGLGRAGNSVSPPLTLTAGTAYYIEALFKEGGGQDHMEVYMAAIDPGTMDVLNPIGGLPAPAAGIIATGTFFSAPGNPDLIAVNLAPNFYATQNQAMTILLDVVASPNLVPFGAFQWQRETGVGSGVFANIPGATTRNLTLYPALSDDGVQYRVLVSYPGLAGPYTTTLHVVGDTEPPVLLAILCDLTNFNTITLIYSEPLDNSQAVPTDPFQYEFDGVPFSSGGTISVDGRAVTFPVTAYLPGSTHTLMVTTIPDLQGNVLTTNATWQACPITPGIAKFRAYDTASTAGTAVSLLTSHPNYPDNPRDMAYIATLDSRKVYPTDIRDQYGARLEGMFIPPVSGDYIFQMTSDDASELWFNPAGPGMGGLALIAQQPACCNNWDGIQSPAQAGLIGGQPYAIRMLYKEGGGGDYGGVAARLTTSPAFTGNDVLPQNGTPLNSIRCSQLAVVENVNNPLLPGSILLVGQPASVSLPVGAMATFQVTNTIVTGSIAPAHYRWQISTDSGATWSDAAGCTLQTNIYVRTLLPQDNGALVRCLVMVPDMRAYSATALITITANPVVASLTTRGNCHEVVAIFSQPMNLDGTYTVSSFYFSGFTTTVLGYGRNTSEVRLRVTPDLVAGLPYVLTVSGATSIAGQSLYPAVSVTGFTHGAEYTSIALTYKRYSGSAGVLLSDLNANPNFPNNPDLVTYNQAFFEIPQDVADNYGATISGYYVAPTTGDYRFWMSSDDQGATFLSTDANPANKVKINEEPIWNGGRAFADVPAGRRTADVNGYPKETQSAPIPLTAGQVVYLEGQMKEGGGGDNYSCAVTINNPVPPANGSLPIPVSAFRQFLRSPGGCTFTRLCDVFLNPPPANLTRVEGQTATFSSQADGTPGEVICYSYQWYKNGVPIPGATTPIYSTGLLDCNDNGSVYSLVAWNDFSSVSNSATLTVTVNTTPPVLLSAFSDNASYQRISVRFSRPLALASAQTVGNYSMINLGDSSPLPVLAAALQPDLSTVILTTAPQARNASYNLTVQDLADRSCLPITLSPNPTTVVLNTSNVCLNLVRRDTWLNLPAVANSMTILYNDPRYPNSPTSTDYLQAFNSPQTAPDVNNYAVRLTGYIVAPETADYQFQVVADDSAYLAVGTDSDPNTPVQLIAVNGDCGACGGPQSAVVHLTAGQAYAVESRFQEGNGGDYLQVYWRNNLSITSYTLLSGLDVGITAPLATLNVAGPANLSVEEHWEVNLTVTATASTSPLLYQWKKNGVVMVGATGPTISFPVVMLGDAGTYSCYVSCPGACAEPTVTLTVTPDISAPSIVSAGSLDGIHVGLCFNEPVDVTTGGDAFNYTVNGGAAPISTLELSPDGRRVVITLGTQISGGFTVNATGITDRATMPHTGNSSATGRVMGLAAVDIGNPGDPIFMGTNFVCTSNTIEVSAGGSDIWNNQDGFNFIYTPFTGDFDMSVRVSRLDFTSTWAKAGLMAREDLTPGSRNHNVIVDPTAGANIYEANKRDVADSGPSSWSTSNPTPQYPNAWVRLCRVGDLFSAYASSNAVDWVLFGTNTPSPGYPRTLYLGMGTTAHDNTGTNTFALYHDFTIRDIESPQFTCTNLVVECDRPAGVQLNSGVPVTDNSGMTPTVVCVPAIPGLFPPGDTMVSCTATDASGNTAECSFTVSVVDRTPPVIANCGPSHSHDAGLSCVFVLPDLRGQIAASDLCGMITIAQTPAPGTVLSIGTNIVTFTVTDSSSNSTSCSVTVGVRERIKPAIVCPPDLVVECGNDILPPATGVATGTDNCDTNVALSYLDHGTVEVRPGSLGGWVLSAVGDPLTASSTFVNGPSPAPIGTGSLRLAVGSNGDSVAQARTASLSGTRLDALTELGFRTYVTASSGNGETPFLLLNIDTDGNGIADDVIGFEPEYQSGYTVAVPNQGLVANGLWQSWNAMVGGWWSINHPAVMSDGNDVQPLSVYIAAFPSARVVNASSGAGGVRLVAGQSFGTWEDFDGNVDRFTVGVNGASTVYDFDLTPGDVNPIPLIVRTWTARDDSGNAISCSQLIRVIDTTAPLLACPTSLFLKTTNPAGDIVNYVVNASDVCDPSPTLVCFPPVGSFFAMGSTPVSCALTDASGNSNACNFVVTLNLVDGANYVVNAPIPDNDANGYASTRMVASQIGILTDVNVRLNITGGYNGDLYAYLVHDSGFSVLLNRVGRRVGDPAGYGDSGFDMVLDDQSTNGDVHVYRMALFGNQTNALAGPLTNSWAPDGRSADPGLVLDSSPRTELLSSFNGLNPNGEWTLFVADIAPIDASTLVSWSLELCGLPPIPPSITLQPANQTVECSSNVTFTVGASGTPPLTNQWYRNGSAIPGANGSSLTFSGMSAGNGDLYIAVVNGMGGSVTSAPATLTVVDTIAPVVVCPGDITVECATSAGTVVSFSPSVIESCSVGLAAVCVPSSGSVFPPGLTTVNCSATDAANNAGNTCTFTVRVVDTTPPVFCINPATVLSAGGTNDNFADVDAADPSQDLEDYLFSLDLRDFDDGGSDRWFAHTFVSLPADISDAVLRIRIRGDLGVPQNDAIQLLFSTSGGGLLPASWSRRIGTGGFDAVPGILPTPWVAGSVTELVLDLSKLRNEDNSFTDLIPTLRAQRYLDIVVQDDTAVDYAVLEIKTCQCQTNIIVNVNPMTCGAVVSFTAPVFADNCDASLTVACVPASGSHFPVGTSSVFCTATDDSGNIARCAFSVVVTEPAPSLRIEPAGANVLLSWPITCAQYRLLSAPSLNPPIIWTPVNAPISISGGEYHVLQPATGPHRFYRLITP